MNYQLESDKIISKIKEQGRVPRLLLHSCCAPCSSYCLEYLTQYFEITDFFYNPNIYPEDEYRKREAELQRLISALPLQNPVHFLGGKYEPEKFFEMAKGLENVPEGGERCFKCYRMRLEEAAFEAQKGGYDFFTTTLSISPLKNAEKLNQIGLELSDKYGIPYFLSDFKKRNGYKRSIELSHEYDLYRQNFCGCVYSKRASVPDNQ